MAKPKSAKPLTQLKLFPPELRPISAPPPIPPPPRVANTVTEQLPDELLADGWRIVWRTERYKDGWFYAVNERLGQRTAEHFYAKHRGFKYALRAIATGKTQPLP